MNPDIGSGSASALPEDFAERVLDEVDRRRAQAQRTRLKLQRLGAGLALAVALIVAGRVPFRLARGIAHRRAAPALVLAAAGDADELQGDGDDLDPGSYFLAGLASGPEAPDLASEPGDDGDTDLLGQE